MKLLSTATDISFVSEWKAPVAIDNTALLQYSVKDGKRVLVLAEGVPFRTVSQEVWDFFYSTYGGGPVIVSSLEPIISNSNE